MVDEDDVDDDDDDDDDDEGSVGGGCLTLGLGRGFVSLCPD